MTGSRWETMREIIFWVWENQKDVESEKKNYIGNIAEGIGIHRITVSRAVEALEEVKLVKTWREGNKKYVRLTWNPERGAEAE